ncbi:pineapple eye protein-like [Anopheles ziemanni]|uniref:pineapple eye protein-like n=1 Tax=Anopheles coustani TaxID=139045 RepID=UPI00265B3BDC|nr:pineapple eye protein-like [Anopheles coustani]XP_058169033.1 pineapple eye protein-like [Anopheles ziemanni]
MTKTCFLCKSSEDDELLYGKFYTKYRISVHYYCLLLSSNLVQNGVNDEVGIFGFLEADIRKENQRTKSCRCYICKGMHANIFCCAKKCLRTFHTVCGIKNRCLAHFTDTFQSWCSVHVPLRADRDPHSAEEPCAICYEEMGLYDRITSIRAPCCKNGWFHQQCVARFAQTAGYFFKCPLCNNVDTFTQEIPLRGVYVPERDAAWELEPNAFQDQLVRPSACDAEKCRCKNGRETDNRKWNLLICGSCGATCRHRKCMESTGSHTYVCQSCRPITGEVVSRLTVDDQDDESDAEDSEDDQNEASSTISSSSSSDDVKQDRAVRKDASHGSEESGCHCSGSDESIVNVRRTKRTRLAIQSESSDSDQSDTSSIVMRRSLMRNTGKRVRRIISEESEATSDKEDSDVATTMLSEEDAINGAPSMSNVEKSAVGQLDENSNTSGTSSLSVGRTHTIRSMSASARTLLDSSNESDNDEKCKEQSRDRRKKSKPSLLECSTVDEKSLPTMSEDRVKCREQPKRTWSSVDDDCTDSTDDILLIKRRRVTNLSSSSEENTDPMERLGEKMRLTEILHTSPESTKNELNSSNEENIHPYGDEEIKKHSNHTTPPPPALGHGFDKSKEKASGKCRGQQSILKFFTNSPRNTPQKLTSSDTDSPMSCSSSVLSRQSDDTNKDAASSKQAKVEGSKSLTESEKKSSRRSKEADAAERSNGSRKASRRKRKQLAVKEQGQANLLHFFNRC